MVLYFIAEIPLKTTSSSIIHLHHPRFKLYFQPAPHIEKPLSAGGLLCFISISVLTGERWDWPGYWWEYESKCSWYWEAGGGRPLYLT